MPLTRRAAPAGTLTGETLAANVVTSSLTSVGTLTSLVNDGNTTLGNASTDTLNVGNGGIIKDASGNVGIANTPPAWNLGNSISVGPAGSAAVQGNGTAARMTANTYFNGTSWVYTTTGTVSLYVQSNGNHTWFSDVSGTAGATYSITQRMLLDTSGNLISTVPATAPSLTTNLTLVVNATTDTNLRFSVRGTDGVTRTANLLLA